MLEAKWKDNREMKDVTMADFLMQQSKWQLKNLSNLRGQLRELNYSSNYPCEKLIALIYNTCQWF